MDNPLWSPATMSENVDTVQIFQTPLGIDARASITEQGIDSAPMPLYPPRYLNESEPDLPWHSTGALSPLLLEPIETLPSESRGQENDVISEYAASDLDFGQSLFDFDSWGDDVGVQKLSSVNRPPLSELDMNDSSTLDLYTELLLFSKDQAKEQLSFSESGDAAKTALRCLALKLGLKYDCRESLQIIEKIRSPTSKFPLTGWTSTKEGGQPVPASNSPQEVGPESPAGDSTMAYDHVLLSYHDSSRPPIVSSSQQHNASTAIGIHTDQRSVQTTSPTINQVSNPPATEQQSCLSNQSPEFIAHLTEWIKNEVVELLKQTGNTEAMAEQQPLGSFHGQSKSANNLDTLQDHDRRPQQSAQPQNSLSGCFGEFAFDSRMTASTSHSQPSSGRRGPMDKIARAAMRAVKAVGACWRCKILRKKCDLLNPCKACPKLDISSLWKVIGCRRGTLYAEVLPVPLCPKSALSLQHSRSEFAESVEHEFDITRTGVFDEVNRCLDEASRRRTEAIKEVELAFGRQNTGASSKFQQIATKVILSQNASSKAPVYDCSSTAYSFKRQIMAIVWELLDNPFSSAIIRNDSAEDLSLKLIAAATYEEDHGDSALVSLAISCLQGCLEMLRLHAEGLLTTKQHDNCKIGHCALKCLRNLDSYLRSYLDELSRVIFRKENLQNDRRWWLSMFYSLYIQSYVRNTLLIVIEPQEAFSESVLNANTWPKSQKYFHLAIRLFTAISAGDDPLTVDWSLDRNIPRSAEEIALVDSRMAAQKVMECSTWTENNINSSYEFLSSVFDDDTFLDKKTAASCRSTIYHDFSPSSVSLVDDSGDGSSVTSQYRQEFRHRVSYDADDDGDLSTRETSWLKGLDTNTSFGGTSGRSSPARNASSKRKRSTTRQTSSPQIPQRNRSAGSLFSKPRRGSYSSTYSVAASSVELGYGRLLPGGVSPKSEKNLDIDIDFPMEEPTGLLRLRIDDNILRLESHPTTSMAGQKRRASTPPAGDSHPSLHTAYSASDLYQRRESALRTSPTPRLHSSQGFISSIESGSRKSSYSSNLPITSNSIASMSPYGRLSPSGISSGGFSHGGVSPKSNDGGNESPYTTLRSFTASPCGSISSPSHQDATHEVRALVSARKSLERNENGIKRIATDKIHKGFVCECCPKKPKKFETGEELNAHEMEKQFKCPYCRTRFKNKNEAERHQNSLHLRRFSWSCAELQDYSAAFHDSPTRPTEADTCGYCGEEFPRIPIGQGGVDAEIAMEHDREVKTCHLVEVHKFGECNSTKKFFRVDHFRQHLKHSHAGKAGQWTNMLENVCMKNEPLPEPNPLEINKGREGLC